MLLEHFQRVKDGVNNVNNLTNLSIWIEKHTKLDGKPFTFKDHEYQRDIIDDPAKTVLVVKAAQTGLSEIFARWGMAACTTQDDFTLIWTFPSTSDAERFAKARLDPVLTASEEFKRALSKTINSVELKQFNANSWAYIRGTLSDTGGLSVPADLLIHDEYDKSDMSNIATYISRLQHKPTKMRRLFSTPTIDKYGISLLAETAKRKRQMWKCSHCTNHWLPNYEQDIKIPGWDRPLKEIDKYNIKDIRYQEAILLCPKCGKSPDTDLEHRQWVIENNHENYDAIAYYVSPFCAPAYLTPSYLVKVSTEFDKWSEFCNQALGLTAEDVTEMLTENDIRTSIVNVELHDSSVHYLGADMGLVCHIMIGRRLPDGTLAIVHREKVAYTAFMERRLELIRKYRVVTSAHDMFPYTDIIKQITDYDPNAYGCVYVTKASTEVFTIKEQEADEELGKLNVRTAYVNRDVGFDALMTEFKAGKVLIKDGEDKEELVQHFRDMKRVKVYDKNGGMMYKWVKTQGRDHYHHAALYLLVAIGLRGTVTNNSAAGIPQLVSKFKVKQQPNMALPYTRG